MERPTSKQKQKQKVVDFADKSYNLFNIEHTNAFNIIKIEEDKLFLLVQREKGRKRYMLTRNKTLAKTEKQAQDKMTNWKNVKIERMLK